MKDPATLGASAASSAVVALPAAFLGLPTEALFGAFCGAFASVLLAREKASMFVLAGTVLGAMLISIAASPWLTALLHSHTASIGASVSSELLMVSSGSAFGARHGLFMAIVSRAKRIISGKSDTGPMPLNGGKGDEQG